MKKALAIALFISGSLAFAQQPTNSIGNFKKSIDDLVSPNSPKLGLNMNSFKLEDFIQNTKTFPELPRESYNKSLKPAGNVPIFIPNGKFFLEIYGEDEDIDYKLRIFDIEKSKYRFRSMG